MAGGELTVLHDSNIRTNPINDRFAQIAVIARPPGDPAEVDPEPPFLTNAMDT